MNLNAFVNALLVGLSNFKINLFLLVTSFFVGLLLGLIIALVRYHEIPIISKVFDLIVYLLKGIPVVVILFLVFLLSISRVTKFLSNFGLEGVQFLGNSLIAMIIGVLCLSIYSITQAAESFRTALNSIDKGQYEAAYASGFTITQTYRKFIFPQLSIIVTPLLGNLAISLLKTTSIISMISIIDAFASARLSATPSYSFVEAYLALLLIFWFFSIIIEQIVKFISHRQQKFYRLEK